MKRQMARPRFLTSRMNVSATPAIILLLVLSTWAHSPRHRPKTAPPQFCRDRSRVNLHQRNNLT